MFSHFDINLRKSFSGRFSWFLTLKIDSEPWKSPIFEGSQINWLTIHISQNPLEDVHLDAKIYLISPEGLWNSTTVVTLPDTIRGQGEYCFCSNGKAYTYKNVDRSINCTFFLVFLDHVTLNLCSNEVFRFIH